ncbi:hypothetical protein R3P38DRAFT_2935801 [Favolaschia claudopus]|uniref:F-box domain-containing protein n=1 Tax=Favolaschia claudopus TaxID=2862362 RepID=A0AAW0BNX2_9AGAR
MEAKASLLDPPAQTIVQGAMVRSEQDQSLVQQQLAANDLMGRLPFEISAQIFIHCLPGKQKDRTASLEHAPLLLLNICNAWTDIAKSTPLLWCTIHIEFPRPVSFKELLEAWFIRARNYPLTVSLRGQCHPHIAVVIWNHSHRLEHLIVDNGDCLDRDSLGTLEIFPGGMARVPEQFIALRTLTIRGSEYSNLQFLGPQIMELLRRAPNVVECTFIRMPLAVGFHDIDWDPPLVFPSLRRLRFGEHVKPGIIENEFLKCVSLPALEALAYPFEYFSSDHFIAFLNRSAPSNLRELSGCDGLGDFVLDGGLHLIPSLTRFEVWWTQYSFAEKALVALAASSSLLPKLQTLIIHLEGQQCAFPEALWKGLLNLLAAPSRRSQLTNVLLYGIPESLMPAEGIRAELREAAKICGAQVRMGSRRKNFMK